MLLKTASTESVPNRERMARWGRASTRLSSMQEPGGHVQFTLSPEEIEYLTIQRRCQTSPGEECSNGFNRILQSQRCGKTVGNWQI